MKRERRRRPRSSKALTYTPRLRTTTYSSSSNDTFTSSLGIQVLAISIYLLAADSKCSARESAMARSGYQPLEHRQYNPMRRSIFKNAIEIMVVVAKLRQQYLITWIYACGVVSRRRAARLRKKRRQPASSTRMPPVISSIKHVLALTLHLSFVCGRHVSKKMSTPGHLGGRNLNRKAAAPQSRVGMICSNLITIGIFCPKPQTDKNSHI